MSLTRGPAGNFSLAKRSKLLQHVDLNGQVTYGGKNPQGTGVH